MKKFLTLVALVCMVLSSTVAFAQAFPSKTAQDMTTVKLNEMSGTCELTTCDHSAGAFICWSIFVTEPSELIEEEVKLMGEHVAAESIATFFDAEVQEQLPEFKPEAVADVNELIAYELVAVACDGYKETYGDAVASFTFATAYEEGAEVTVMLGLPKETVEENTDALTWSVQKCVVENGKINVKFLQKELVQMEEIPALLVVLSAELA